MPPQVAETTDIPETQAEEQPKTFTEEELLEHGRRQYLAGLNAAIERKIASDTREALPPFDSQETLRSRPSVWG